MLLWMCFCGEGPSQKVLKSLGGRVTVASPAEWQELHSCWCSGGGSTMMAQGGGSIVQAIQRLCHHLHLCITASVSVLKSRLSITL